MAILTSSVNGSTVTFKITIETNDPPNWEVVVSAKTDRRLGQTGRDPSCNFYVEDFVGVGTSTVVKTYIPDSYCAVLALRGIGEVDYTMFAVLPTPPKAQIFNWCWGETGKLGGSCPMPTSLPPVKAGTVIDIKADIVNTGATGSVMVIYKIDGLALFTETNVSLVGYPSGGMWSPTFTKYTMPNKNVTLVIESYNWDGTKWNLGQTKTQSISTISPGCAGIDLTPFAASIKTGEKVDMTTSVSPGNIPFIVTFKDRGGATLGTCRTSGTGQATGSSTCMFTWDSSASYAGKTGTYYIKAYADSCMSTESAIVVDAPIYQYNFSIYVQDFVTNSPLSGATVLVATTEGASQSKITDTNGLALFRMDSGTISISISKNQYNTYNTVESLYNDISKTYSITPIPPKPTIGDVQFVSVPSGAEIFIDGKTTSQKTPMTVTGIPAGDHNWILKLTGYNDSSSKVTVPSGGLIQVYTTLTTVTPTSGSLNITSRPMGGEVWIDDADMKQTTSGMTIITDIPPGSHSYKIILAGFQDATGKFDIKVGQTTYLDIELIPLTTIGTLEITSEPSGARVFVDDKDTQRNTPATIASIVEGDHRYKTILSGYKDISGVVTIISGQTEKVHLILEKSGTGLEVVAAVAIAGVAILTFVSGKEKR